MRVLSTICLLLVLAPVHADVKNSLIVAGITDDPEPIGIWAVAGPLGSTTLNPGGDARADGRPDIWWPSITDDPEPVGIAAVWAWNTGADHDIAFAEWDGLAWSSVEFLTASTDDERDPRLFVDATGTAYVVWWVAGPDDVFLATRPSGGVWTQPVLVTQGVEQGRRPSVAVDDGAVYVAYEYDGEVLVAEPQPSGTFIRTLIGSTTRADPLEPIVHAEDGTVWVDWLHDATTVGCSERVTGSWSSVAGEPWLDPSWIGVETARRAVRAAVLSP